MAKAPPKTNAPLRTRRGREVLRPLSLRRRHLGFDAIVLLLTVSCLIAIYLAKVLPLTAPPTGPPDGLSVAWAGDPLRLGAYAETMTLSAASCHAPVMVSLMVFGREVPAGRVGFAVTGNAAAAVRDVRVYTSPANAETPSRLAAGAPLASTVQRPAVETTVQGSGRFQTTSYAFDIDPRHPLIDVTFRADWTASRTGDDACWLNVPKLIGSFDDAASSANRAIGAPADYYRTGFGYPLTHANVVVQPDLGAEVRVDSTNSIPVPSSLDPPSWTCDTSDRTHETNCQTFALLAKPGADQSRARSLAIWSIAAGLLLALFGDALVAILRALVLREPDYKA